MALRETYDHCGDAGESAGASEAAGVGGHPGAPGVVGEEGVKGVVEGPVGGVRLQQDLCGSGLGEDFGVFALVVVGGLGERNKEGGAAGGAEFGDGAAAAGKDKVGGGVLGWHVVEEGFDGYG